VEQEEGIDMHGVFNSKGPDGFWEHGHPPCGECLKYHEHIKAITAERDKFRKKIKALQAVLRGR